MAASFDGRYDVGGDLPGRRAPGSRWSDSSRNRRYMVERLGTCDLVQPAPCRHSSPQVWQQNLRRARSCRAMKRRLQGRGPTWRGAESEEVRTNTPGSVLTPSPEDTLRRPQHCELHIVPGDRGGPGVLKGEQSFRTSILGCSGSLDGGPCVFGAPGFDSGRKLGPFDSWAAAFQNRANHTLSTWVAAQDAHISA